MEFPLLPEYKRFGEFNMGPQFSEWFTAEIVPIDSHGFESELQAIRIKENLALDKTYSCQATLIIDETIEEDFNRIAVFIESKEVGRLTRRDEIEAKAKLIELGGVAFAKISIFYVDLLDGEEDAQLNLLYKQNVSVPNTIQLPNLDLSYIDLSSIISADLLTETLLYGSCFYEWEDEVTCEQTHEPINVVLQCLDGPKNESLIGFFGYQGYLGAIPAKDAPDLFDAVLEVNQRALSAFQITHVNGRNPRAQFVKTPPRPNLSKKILRSFEEIRKESSPL
jgi:hypothetical protein